MIVSVLAIAAYQSGRLEAQVVQPAPVLTPVSTVTLHGSTPSMAWSPDSTRVVVNSAYEYFGHDAQIRANAAGLGIYVVDARNGSATHVFTGQGYHPFWRDRTTVGWGHSEYEDGPPGIFVAQVTQGSQPQKIGSFRGVHRTLLARGGAILAFVGFPEYLDWVLVDPRTGQGSQVAALSSVSSWSDPAGHYEDQCLRQAGGARVVPSSSGFALMVRGRPAMVTAGPLYAYSGDGGSGFVRPCLSADGRHVAFLTPTQGIGDFALTISNVP